MDRHAYTTFMDTAARFLREALRLEPGEALPPEYLTLLTVRAGYVRTHAGTSGDGWDEAMVQGMCKEFGTAPDQRRGPHIDPFRVPGCAIHRSLRLAHAMTTRTDALADDGPARRGASRDGDRVPDRVRYRFPYRLTGAFGRALPHHGIGEGEIQLSLVTDERAPAVANLIAADGSAITLRRMDGVLLRPVLSPGSWRPMSPDAFASTAIEAGPWVDNPFLARAAHDESVMGLDDIGVRQANPSRADATARAVAERECDARAAGLVVVAGCVHRPCPEPTLMLSRIRVRKLGEVTDRGVEVAWRLGDDIDMHTDQDPMRATCTMAPDDLTLGSGLSLRNPAPTFGLGDAAALADLAEDLRDGLGAAKRPGIARTRVCRDVDPTTFPSREAAMLEHVEALCAAGVPPWTDLHGRDDDGLVMALEDLADTGRVLAADAVGQGSSPVRHLVMASMARLAAAQAETRLLQDAALSSLRP